MVPGTVPRISAWILLRMELHGERVEDLQMSEGAYVGYEVVDLGTPVVMAEYHHRGLDVPS